MVWGAARGNERALAFQVRVSTTPLGIVPTAIVHQSDRKKLIIEIGEEEIPRNSILGRGKGNGQWIWK